MKQVINQVVEWFVSLKERVSARGLELGFIAFDLC